MTDKQKRYLRLIAVALMGVVVLRLLAVKLGTSLTIRKQLTKRLESLQVKRDILNGLDQPMIDDRVQKMEAVFPSVKPIVPLMATLSQLALDQELTFGGISLSPGSLSEDQSAAKKAGDPQLNDLKFGFQVSGDFDRISGFLKSLENTAPLMKIDEVGLTIKTNPLFDREATKVVANIKLSAYYQAPPQSLGSIEAPIKLLSRSDEQLLNKLIGFKTFPPVIPLTSVGKENLFE